jgi:NTP pyrophosphatase (non-canonical NTP hydrolase)
MKDVEQKVISWAYDRNLIEGSDPKAQCLKTVSEVGELADNINKGDHNGAMDDIGDIMVTLIILSEQIGTSIEDCLRLAYNEIKDRKGKMVNGVFVKEA